MMTFPSPEFNDAVGTLCHGTASDTVVAELHSLLASNIAARDEYLLQVELHSLLASSVNVERRSVPILSDEPPRLNPRRPRWASRRLLRWSAVAAGLVTISVVFWNAAHRDESEVAPVVSGIEGGPPRWAKGLGEPQSKDERPSVVPAKVHGSPAGIYKPTVQFAAASNAPIIVGTGRNDPIELGAEVPYTESGHTLHIWDWSKSTKSRVMKDIRLWPEDVIALSSKGKFLVWAKGDILHSTSGERSRIDLGGAYLLDDVRRIASLQFSPDDQRLAVRVSNVLLTKSTHPLRHHDVSTTLTFQIVAFPSGKLVCEFPAEITSPLAFSADGKRISTSYSAGKSGQKIVERNGDTGEIIREFKPELSEYAKAICYSNDGRHLAATDSTGEVLIWDTTTGELKHKVATSKSFESYLRFSPDGKLLGLSWLGLSTPAFKIVSIDVAKGAIVSSGKADGAGSIYWESDSKSFRIVCTRRGLLEKANAGDNEGATMPYNLFPVVKP